MPLPKRTVSPIDVSLHRLPPNVRREELECVANGTFSNLVRQLSSLSRHAEDVFGTVYHEAVKLDHKANTLASRVDRLTRKVTQLNSNEEEVFLHDLHLRKPFKSASLIDQHSLDRQTLSTALNEVFSSCDRPPELDKLNPYRDDDKSALRYYTDPSYFFDLWKQEMLKDVEGPSNKRQRNTKARSPSDQVKKKKTKTVSNERQKFFERALRTGEIIDLPAEYQAPELLRLKEQNRGLHPPPGMVRPEPNGLPHNGNYQQTVGNPVQAIYDRHQQQHPHVSVLPTPASVYHQQQHQYQSPTSQQPNVARYATQTSVGQMSQWTSSGDTRLSGSSVSNGQLPSSRPTHAPPSLPYSASSASPADDAHLGHRLNQLNLQQNQQPQITPVRRAPAQPFGGIEEQEEEMDLPPPPPPLSPDQMAMQSSMQASITEKLPSPPPMHVVPVNSSIPPPPPPPPPPSTAKTNGLVIGSFGGGSDRLSPTKTANDQSTTVVHAHSNLLKEIHDGIKLKKVQRQEERAEERAATEGNDVAAILRRRMEHVMGGSDSNSEEDELEDEWDD